MGLLRLYVSWVPGHQAEGESGMDLAPAAGVVLRMVEQGHRRLALFLNFDNFRSLYINTNDTWFVAFSLGVIQ